LLTGKLHQFDFAGFERGKRSFKLSDLLVDGHVLLRSSPIESSNDHLNRA
jgi:hypothetical protein